MRWEFRLQPLLFLLTIALIAGAPLLMSLLGGVPLREQVEVLGNLLADHQFRITSGFFILTLILFEVLYSLRKRGRIRLPGERHSWRSVHMIIGTALVPLIVVHTGGRWGDNLNGMLLTCLVLTILVGLVGKIAEALRARRAMALHAVGANGNGKNGAVKAGVAVTANGNGKHRWSIHQSWLWLHTTFVTGLIVLVAYHIFCVYYY